MLIATIDFVLVVRPDLRWIRHMHTISVSVCTYVQYILLVENGPPAGTGVHGA
jgi:hypothetical protein